MQYAVLCGRRRKHVAIGKTVFVIPEQRFARIIGVHESGKLFRVEAGEGQLRRTKSDKAREEGDKEHSEANTITQEDEERESQNEHVTEQDTQSEDIKERETRSEDSTVRNTQSEDIAYCVWAASDLLAT